MLRDRVNAARAFQARRYAMFGLDPSTVNARCPAALLDEICELDSDGRPSSRTGGKRQRPIGEGVSSHSSARAHDCGSGWEPH